MAKAFKKFEAEVKAKAKALALDKGSYVCDGGGLYVQLSKVKAASGNVNPPHAFPLGRPASYVFRYRSRATGKLREMGLGPYGDVDLEKARAKASEFRDMLRDGVDPIDRREQERAAQIVAAAKGIDFEDAAKQYIKAHKAGWKNEKHAEQWQNTLDTYAVPIFKKVPVAQIDVTLVLKVLEPIWQTKTETASRVRGRIENVLDWATVRGYREGLNPARWKGHLEHLLKSRKEMAGAGNKAAKVEHHAALPYDDIGDFMQSLRQQKGVAALALEFTIHTACRTGEVIGATWDEIDLKAAEWNIPAERMKMKKPHRVPLTDRTVEILREVEKLKAGEFVFPGMKAKAPLSNMAMLKTLERMGRDDLTVHGFRSTFRDWAAECTAHPNHVVEMALAHTIENQAEAAYRRGDLFEKRRNLMKDWAYRCNTPKTTADNVVSLHEAAA